MLGFAISDKGDVIVENGKIKTVSDKDLIIQTVRQVLKTNLGEWWLNENEGIDRYSIICKNPNYDEIENNILVGLKQVDDTFTITRFDCSEKANRMLEINFTATNKSGETIEINL